MPSLIGDVWSDFIGGRNIFDGVLVTNEIVDWWKRNKKKGLLLKLDFEKAYDSVNWFFLLNMLKTFGFGDKWVRWIRECIFTVSLSVFVNGSLSSQFFLEKGLR